MLLSLQRSRREYRESITRRKYFCMRLASGCLRPGGDWREDAPNWRLSWTIGRRGAEETKPDRYTPQKPGPEARLLFLRRERGNWIAVRLWTTRANCNRNRNIGEGRFGRGAMYRNALQSFVAGESRNAALATLQRIALTEKLLRGINRSLQITHLQAPNL